MAIAIAGIVFVGASALAAATLEPAWAMAAEAVLLAGYLGLLARGIFSIRSSLVEPTAWRSDDRNETRIALTFDDGPHPVFTPRVLDVLASRGVKATFFLIGVNVRRHPEVARRIVEEGHEVACHADSHSTRTPWFRPARMERELRACLDSIREATGRTPRLYRPPFGFRTPAHSGVAARNDLRVIGMARRGLDKKAGVTAAALVERTVRSARGGEVIALHDGDEPGRSSVTCAAADALPAVLDGLAARGLHPVTVSSLLVERPYRETPARAWSGRTRGGRFGNAFFEWMVRLVGPGAATVFVVPVAAWFVVAGGAGRRASLELRRRLHGRANPFVEAWWVWRHFFVFGRTLLARVAFVRRGASVATKEVRGYEDVRDVVEGPGGFLIVSAHFGDWAEVSRAFQGRGRELWIVAYKGMGLGSHQVGRDSVERPFHVIDVEGPPVDVATQIMAALSRGHAVALLGDRVFAGDGVPAQFLGGEAMFPKGVWAVAMLTGAPAVVTFAVPEGPNRVLIHVRGPIRVPRVAAPQREAALRDAAAQYARHLEEVVRLHPFQWANFFDFWGRP